jgi:DNA (cytosine-5)-methyltransferase 1
MKILNLYAGIGGNRKLWGDQHEITAVEFDQDIANVYKEYFPDDTVLVEDAHSFLLNNYMNYDFIWSSPPCPSHSEIRRCGTYRGQQPAIYPEMDLYQQIILLQAYAKKNAKWLIENVNPYYEPLIQPTKKLHRHFYWSNFPIGNFDITNDRTHLAIKSKSNVYGFYVGDSNIKNKVKSLRNMVDPELGGYIFNCARNIINRPKTKQQLLFS